MITINEFKNKLSSGSRLLGIDLGTKRIGIAISDYNQKISIYVEEPHFTKPIYKKQDGTKITMTPQMARYDNLTYSCDLYVNVRIITHIYNQLENHYETKRNKQFS